MKKAVIYQRKKAYFVRAQSETVTGLWIESEPTIVVASDATPTEIGTAITAALDGARSGVPHPTDWKAVVAPLLARAGVKSYEAFAKSAAVIDVQEDDGQVGLLPTKNRGSRHGFVEDTKNRVLTTRQDPARLGELVVDLFARTPK